MKRFLEFSFIVKVLVFFTGWGFFYYFLFSRPVYREPIFYFIDNKIFFVPETNDFHIYDNLSFKKFEYLKNFEESVTIKINNKEFSFQKEIFDFKFFIKNFYIYILLSFVLLFSAIIYFDFYKDLFLFLLFLLKSLLVLVFLHILYFQSFSSIIFWNLLLSVFIVVFFNINLKFLGRNIPSLLLLLEILFIVLYFSFVLFRWIEYKDFDINQHSIYLLQIYGYMSLFFIFMNFLRIFLFELHINEHIRILIYILASILGISTPFFIYYFELNEISFESFAIYFYLYPFLFFFVFYRTGFLTSQIVVTRVFVMGFIFLLFATAYFFSIYLYDLYFPEMIKNYKTLYDILFLIILSVYIEPLREKLFVFLKKRFIIPEKKYIDSLMKLSQILSKISRPNLAIIQFLNEIKNTLEIEKCMFMFQSGLLPDIQLYEYTAIQISGENKIWKEIKPEKIIVAPYIIYSTGKRKELFNILYSHNIFLCMGLGKRKEFFDLLYIQILRIVNFFYKIFSKKELKIYKYNIEKELPRSALLIGYPSRRGKFNSREIYYLQEVTRLATMMLTNMHILFKEVEKRKKVRFINLTGKFQKQLTFEEKNLPSGIQIKYFSKPVLSVSGDYIDIIPYKKDFIYCFLGDVSGHGLGTGYLVSAIRSIVHYCIRKDKTLVEVVNYINLFLTNRYQGYEFLTLFAFLLNITDGKFEYINAAHPGIFIIARDEPIHKIEKTQKILGISESGYESYTIKIKPESKIFLFSDGVIETFNKNNEMFGEHRLYQFLLENRNLTIPQIVDKLYDYLLIFRDGEDLHDDTTFLAIDYNPPKNIFNLILEQLFKK